MSESSQQRITRVRKPRVHITYEVDIGDAQVVKELPFVVGVVGDFSADPTSDLEPLRDRKFVQIDRDNFNEVMQRMTPGLSFKVENTFGDDDSQMAVDLKFDSIEDFEPGRVVDQVPALRQMLETRNKLRDLMGKTDRSTELEGLLEQVLQNEDDLKKFASELGIKTEAEGDDKQPEEQG